jgi:nicotinamide phosphoribosyltransferase
MGGALMQGNENVSNNRDTQGFAIKNSSITYKNGDKRDVYKDPITAPEKKSKKGELTLWFNKETQKYITAPKNSDEAKEYGFSDALHIVFRNGEVIKEWTFDEVRNF